MPGRPIWNTTMRYTSIVLSCIGLPCLLLLTACSRNDNQVASSIDTDAALPKPAAGNGSVTGMPDRPGPGPIGDAVHAQGTIQDSPFSGDSLGTMAGIEDGAPGIDGPVDTDGVSVVVGPAAQDALSVLHDYYAAINARQYDRAYSLWSDDGKASGQTQQQFTNGFADTVNVEARFGEPGRVDAAAGSRFIQVPLSIMATHDNGDVRRYIGSYTLRRAVVDGATPEQRAWRVASADIRVVNP